ncbi:GntR family transcriptional regulator [Pseudonocardia eucalypti]|uniref:GntR family transcriptional regulator n=1 Tax=Pseudonocardia eucalypti TaxID=648755 RepID=A0ABP9QEM9_9PSEU|nr:GntR family transcriptional regulator [Pseudonocardia eucalypti]
MTIDLGARAPKYQRIAEQLRREIAAGQYKPGERMPAETDLVERFGVSLPTIRQALSVLRAEGLIESRQGKGTFVKETRKLQRRSRHRYGRARADGKLLTSHLRHEIAAAGREATPSHVAEAIADAPAEMVVRRRVLRDAESGQAEEVGASYIPTDIAGGTFLEEPTVVPKALFLCVEDLSGTTYAYARDRWEVRMPSAYEADVLDLVPGATVIHVLHVAEGADGRVLEVSESVWPSDRIVILDDYPITPDAEVPGAPSEV